MVHHRTVDTLGKMLRAGTIDQAMHDAGRDLMQLLHRRVRSHRGLWDQDGAPHFIGLDHITGVLVEISVKSYKSRLIIGRRGDGQ